MAASMNLKRKHEDDQNGHSYSCHGSKSEKISGSASINKDSLSKFISWCDENNFQLSPKVAVSRHGSCAQYGMHATEDIAQGYCLFQIPRSSLLMPNNSDIADLIDSDISNLTSTNQWIPLLLTLLHEYNKTDSKWAPYLSLAPDPDAINLPMFWEKIEVDKLLKGTGVDTAVERDLKMIEADFQNLVLPFIHKTGGKIRSEGINLDSFKKMVAFVMAYSFTEPATDKADSEEEEEEEEDENSGTEKLKPPMMVPMADMLNHITKHNAKLTFGSEALKMVTTRAIKKGEEIFNTYGQVSNLHLMHMYGFAEPYPDNTNDVVEIPVNRLLEAAKEKANGNTKDLELTDIKWKKLIEQEIIAEDDVFVLGKDGIMNDDICTQALKVLCMSSSAYEEYVEREGWSDAASEASDEEENSLSIECLSKLNKEQKALLQRMGELHLQNYGITPEAAAHKMETVSALAAHERYALFTVYGQQMLIKQLINACSV